MPFDERPGPAREAEILARVGDGLVPFDVDEAAAGCNLRSERDLTARGALSGAGSGSEGPHVTFRYQHIQDDDGHHLIVGREGKLTQCEDEVSHTQRLP